MSNPIDPLEAATVLGELLRSKPKNATGLVNAIMSNDLVPQPTKDYLGNLIEDFNNVVNEGGVSKPFAPRRTFENVVEENGLDRKATNEVVKHLYEDDIASGLMEKMGTDADLPPPPLTMHDQVEAAYNAHTEGDNHE